MATQSLNLEIDLHVDFRTTPMPMNADEIERLIVAALPDARVELTDLRGDGDHYQAVVESASFVGKSRIQQHQMVFAALQGRVGGVLHALALTTCVPEQPENRSE